MLAQAALILVLIPFTKGFLAPEYPRIYSTVLQREQILCKWINRSELANREVASSTIGPTADEPLPTTIWTQFCSIVLDERLTKTDIATRMNEWIQNADRGVQMFFLLHHNTSVAHSNSKREQFTARIKGDPAKELNGQILAVLSNENISLAEERDQIVQLLNGSSKKALSEIVTMDFLDFAPLTPTRGKEWGEDKAQTNDLSWPHEGGRLNNYRSSSRNPDFRHRRTHMHQGGMDFGRWRWGGGRPNERLSKTILNRFRKECGHCAETGMGRGCKRCHAQHQIIFGNPI